MDSNEADDTSKVIGILSSRKLASILKINVDELRSVAKNASSFYRPFFKLKPKKRKIDNPTGRLKVIQKAIDDKLLKKIALPETVLGGVPGKSVRDNAAFHTGQSVIVTIDIKKCFPNTKGFSVFKLFRNYFKYSTVNAKLLTSLTTVGDYVPQGSPCSSSIINLCLLSLHNDFQKLAEKYNLICTIWVDDITVSGENSDKHINEYVEILKKYQYRTQCKKVRVMRKSKKQEVTGVAVNNYVSVPSKKISEIKKLVHDIRIKKFNEDSKEYFSLKGKMEFVKYINKKQFDILNRFLNKCGIKI